MCITHYYMPHGLGNFTSIVLSCLPDGIDFYPFLQGKSQEGELPKRTKKQFIFNNLICLQSYIDLQCHIAKRFSSYHYFMPKLTWWLLKALFHAANLQNNDKTHAIYKNKRTPITPLQVLEPTSVVFIQLKTCQTTYHQHQTKKQTIISHA